jgi:hypothetical protein
LLTVAIVLTPSRATAQGFPWQDFERRTFQQLIKINAEEDAEDLKRYPDKNRMIMRGKILPTVVRVTYTGESRSIGVERKEFIKLWAGSNSAFQPGYADLFENEYLFKEGNDEYWLPVQKKVAAYFAAELKASDLVDIYLIRPGALRVKDKTDWVFLVEEFQKPKSQN